MMKKKFDEKLVVNLSLVPLSGDQMTGVSKGLSFLSRPWENLIGVNLREDMDRSLRDLRRKAFSKKINSQSRGTKLISEGSVSEADGTFMKVSNRLLNT